VGEGESALITVASMKSAAALKEFTLRELGELAQKVGVANWRSMRKEQLIRSLVRAAKRSGPKSSAGKAAKRKPAEPAAKRTAKVASSRRTAAPRSRSATKSAASRTRSAAKTAKTTKRTAARTPVTARKSKPVPSKKPAPKPNPRAVRRIQQVKETRERRMDLSQTLLHVGKNGDGKTKNGRPDRDRIVLLVRDAYWVQACWDLTRQSIDRARAAMAENWHTAKPVLRVFEVDGGATTSAAERVSRDIPIHGGVRNWYIDVESPPKSYRVEIGYLSNNGKFYSLARSNTVTTPAPGASDGLDGNWTDVAENYERIYALSGGYNEEHSSGELQEMFEERLQRPMGSPVAARFGVGAERMLNRQREFEFEVDAEMVIFGRTKKDGRVTLAGEPVKLRDDGGFTVRLSLPDRRQVLPIVASSADGVEQRTIVLAVERNTKVMEPVIHETAD
jgi:uncharacterized protein